MILVDAVFIHTGGGKSLLDYLISELNKTAVEVFYLLDHRYESLMPEIIGNKKFIHGFSERCLFYNKHKNLFNRVFCLGNIPPHINLKNTEVIMYFHSVSYLNPIIQDTLTQKLSQYLKKQIFYRLRKNADIWMVQTEFVKKVFMDKTKISADKVKVLPFFKTIHKTSETIDKEKNSFFYPGSAEPHKNHKRLIDAFCKFYDQYRSGILYLTVHDSFNEIFDYIEFKKKQSYPIYNLGYITDKRILAHMYSKSEFLIFPSLHESFGLPLIEAVEFDCKIIASNLHYVFQVCVPSWSFDPYNIQDLTKALGETIENQNLAKSHAIVFNNIDQIISHITK